MPKAFTFERPNHGLTDEWHTPQWLLDALGPFDDDPCLPGRGDGLTRPWEGSVWLNPPYRQVKPFLKKMVEHGDGVALVFARTETKWAHEYVWPHASAVFFFKGRLHFLRNGTEKAGNAGAPNMLAIYGSHNIPRVRNIPGVLVRVDLASV